MPRIWFVIDRADCGTEDCVLGRIELWRRVLKELRVMFEVVVLAYVRAIRLLRTGMRHRKAWEIIVVALLGTLGLLDEFRELNE